MNNTAESGAIASMGGHNLPPMLQSYLEYKRQYPECLIFFQVGDFYELFFDDAVTASRILNLTLTSRDKSSPNPIPMAGVPIAVVDNYLERLMAQGLSVAIVSQLGGEVVGKSVPRALERIVTPSIRVLAPEAQRGQPSLLVAVYADLERQSASIAVSQVETGVVALHDAVPIIQLRQEVARLGPTEILFLKGAGLRVIDRRFGWVREFESLVSPRGLKLRPEVQLDTQGLSSRDWASIPGYGQLSTLSKRAARLLLEYVDEATVGRLVPVREMSTHVQSSRLAIDATTRANLELVQNLRDGSSTGTLLSVIDKTATPMGARLLRSWLLAPLTELEEIERRQDAVCWLKDCSAGRQRVRSLLNQIPDLERLASRIQLEVSGPRELGAVRDLAQLLPLLREEIPLHGAPEVLEELRRRLQIQPAITEPLSQALSEELPFSIQDGGVIRQGFDAEIDRLRELRGQGRSWILALEQQEREATGIQSLKIKYNGVLGYFIEVSQVNATKVPAHYIRRQSTANTERFTTPELRAREVEVVGADEKLLVREKSLFEALRRELKASVTNLQDLARDVALLDCLQSLGEVADLEGYIRPQLSEKPLLRIKGGRHPVLSKLLGTHFIANDLECGGAAAHCLVLTGPNMGGKSTFLRQAALLAILAHIGSCIPAQEALVGIVDKVFARLGASDNQLEGESTFMLEMREAAFILGHATSQSLVLVDEIGRGTATSDGLAVAQAVLEWLVKIAQSRTIFATHFHELTRMQDMLSGVGNVSVGCVEQGDDVLFTHEIKMGPASRSYGIQVAQLAGLPVGVLERARLLLRELQSGEPAVVRAGKVTAPDRQLSLFEVSREKSAEQKALEEEVQLLRTLASRVDSFSVDSSTPLEALLFLADLKKARA